MDKRAQ
jgi:hypothetical protein